MIQIEVGKYPLVELEACYQAAVETLDRKWRSYEIDQGVLVAVRLRTQVLLQLKNGCTREVIDGDSPRPYLWDSNVSEAVRRHRVAYHHWE